MYNCSLVSQTEDKNNDTYYDTRITNTLKL